MNKVSIKATDEEQFYSREGYLIELNSDRWKLSKDIAIPVGSVAGYLKDKEYSFRKVLEFYAKTAAPSHAKNIFSRFLHYCEQMHETDLLSVESLISYRSNLSKNNEWYLGTLRGGLRQWFQLGYPGVSENVMLLLDKWRIKGNEKGFAVQSMCPDDGPLTDIELQGIVAALIDGFTNKSLTLVDACVAMILAMTGRRPSQIAALKIGDLISSENNYWINFPRAKQRNSPWRSSFNRFAIVEDLWLLLQQQAEAVKDEFSKLMNDGLSKKTAQSLPLFPDRRLKVNHHNVVDSLDNPLCQD